MPSPKDLFHTAIALILGVGRCLLAGYAEGIPITEFLSCNQRRLELSKKCCFSFVQFDIG